MKSSKVLFPAVCAVCCLLTVSCAVSNSLFESMSAVGEITPRRRKPSHRNRNII